MALIGQPRTRLAARVAAWRLAAPLALADTQRPLPWRWLWLQALTVWGATRLAFALLTLYYPLVTGGENPNRSTVALASTLHRWMNWDGGIYVHLAQSGYSPPEYSVFFPLYPVLIRVCAFIIGPHWAAAALLVSNLGALLAFGGVAALAAQVAAVEHERQVARTALILFAVYPLAFFTAAAYTDGLFVGLAAFALLCGMRRRWLLAAAFALLAGWSRPVGPALILPLAWEAIQCYRAARAESTPAQALRLTAPALAAICAPIISVLTFSAYLWQRFGDPLIIIHSERHWAHISISPIISIPLAIFAFAHIAINSPLQWRVLLDLAPVVGALIITLVAARRAPIAFTLYMLGLLYIVTSSPINYTDLFVSGGRYMIAAIPVVIALAGWLRRADWLLPALCLCGASLQAILTIYFLGHGWIV
ncbi:MAG: mannosyltransferase family protein [Ktedonobacterales bacterium]